MKKKLYIASLISAFSIVIGLLVFLEIRDSNRLSFESPDFRQEETLPVYDPSIKNDDIDNDSTDKTIIEDDSSSNSASVDSSNTINKHDYVKKPSSDISDTDKVVEEEKPTSNSSPSNLQQTPTPSIPDSSSTIPDVPPLQTTDDDSKETDIFNDNNIPDPTHPLYSRHLGQVDYPIEKFDNDIGATFDACMGAGFDINFSHPVEILSFSCVEVYSKNQKILGYYLELICNDKCNESFKTRQP